MSCMVIGFDGQAGVSYVLPRRISMGCDMLRPMGLVWLSCWALSIADLVVQ